MDAINSIATAFNSSLLMSGILMPAFLCLVMYVVYRKRDELTRHAIQNTAATLVVAFMNFGVALLFYKDINRFLQRVYDSLGIPTLPETVWDGWPLVLVAIIGIVVKDFADYWNHRLMHTEWGWPTHAAHHSDTHVNAFTTYRVHFFEAIVMSGSYIVLPTAPPPPTAPRSRRADTPHWTPTCLPQRQKRSRQSRQSIPETPAPRLPPGTPPKAGHRSR